MAMLIFKTDFPLFKCPPKGILFPPDLRDAFGPYS